MQNVTLITQIHEDKIVVKVYAFENQISVLKKTIIISEDLDVKVYNPIIEKKEVTNEKK